MLWGLPWISHKVFLSVPVYKRKGYKKEAGKILTKQHHAAKNGRQFGPYSKPLARASCLHRQHGWLRFPTPSRGLGLPVCHSSSAQIAGQVGHFTHLARAHILGEQLKAYGHCGLRLHPSGMGRGGGGVNISTNEVNHDFWVRNNDHINLKEIEASINTTRAFAVPGSVVHLNVDNSVALSCLLCHGGKIGRLNELLRTFLICMNHHQVSVVPRLVPSQEMRADEVGGGPRGLLP